MKKKNYFFEKFLEKNKIIYPLLTIKDKTILSKQTIPPNKPIIAIPNTLIINTFTIQSSQIGPILPKEMSL